VIRLAGFLIIVAVTAGGSMYFDFKMSAKRAGQEGAEGPTFTDYLSGLPGRVAGLTSAAAANGLPTKLSDMLPRPPEGWTQRPVTAEDVAAFLPKSAGKADERAVAAINAMALADGGDGTDVVALAYEKGDRVVLIRAIRYPNDIFIGSAALDQRAKLQDRTAQFRGTEFATVRGLDVTEDLLPEGFRGRMFLADVGAQIHLSILVPKRTKDTDLLPFLETLQVEAMNASVIDKVEGLGQVPVIVLASALNEAGRDAYLADVAARKSLETAREASGRAEAEAQLAATATQDQGGGLLGRLFGMKGQAETPETPAVAAKTDAEEIVCETGKDGVKRCKVEGAQVTGD
jgi:hypothetical protein